MALASPWGSFLDWRPLRYDPALHLTEVDSSSPPKLYHFRPNLTVGSTRASCVPNLISTGRPIGDDWGGDSHFWSGGYIAARRHQC